MGTCAFRCKTLRRTQYHLHSTLAGSVYSESNLEELSDKPKMRNVLLKKCGGGYMGAGGGCSL